MFSLELANVVLSRLDKGVHEGIHVADLLLLNKPVKGESEEDGIEFVNEENRPSCLTAGLRRTSLTTTNTQQEYARANPTQSIAETPNYTKTSKLTKNTNLPLEKGRHVVRHEVSDAQAL